MSSPRSYPTLSLVHTNPDLEIHRGASRGIGRGIALQLASRGAAIIGTCSAESSLPKIDTLRAEVETLYPPSCGVSPPKIVGVVAPLTQPQESSASIVEAVASNGGNLNILVQNAAVVEVAPVGMITQEHVTRMLTANIEAPVFLVQALLPYFRQDSRIINISSEDGRDPSPVACMPNFSRKLTIRRANNSCFQVVYSGCKSALESMTRVWADALGTRPGMERTTVNAVAVGSKSQQELG